MGFELPLTMIAFTVATAGMVGIMPLSTFWSKFYLMKGAIQSGSVSLALVLIISGIINAACFVPVIISAFSGEKAAARKRADKSLVLMIAPTVVLVVLSVIIGLWPGLVWQGVEYVAKGFFN